MKISGFTFLRNAEELGFPFIESIKSILPICDEFVIALGECQDNTEEMILAINDPRIRIIHTIWNSHMQSKGYVYGQQKMIAQFACAGDWTFYLEGDEIVHENDLDNILNSMKKHKDDNDVEALVFNYYHFYGNKNTIVYSPRWYRKAPRIIKSSVRSYAPDGLYWLVLDEKKSNRNARYPKAKVLDAYMYHYGWARPENAMTKKINQVNKYWGNIAPVKIEYSEVDPQTLKPFTGTHPQILGNYLPEENGLYQPKPRPLSKRDKRQRVKSKLESLLKIDLARKYHIDV